MNTWIFRPLKDQQTKQCRPQRRSLHEIIKGAPESAGVCQSLLSLPELAKLCQRLTDLQIMTDSAIENSTDDQNICRHKTQAKKAFLASVGVGGGRLVVPLSCSIS